MISLIDAGPGTGKTYSLTNGYLKMSKTVFGEIPATEEQQEIWDYLNEEFPPSASVCFFAHSNSTKDNLISKLPGAKAKVYTFHGAGMSAIIKKYGFNKPNNKRVENHIQLLTGTKLQAMNYREKTEWYSIKKVVHFLKIEDLLPNDAALGYLVDKYPEMSGHNLPDDWQDKTSSLLEMASIPDGEIDYDDMVWLGKKAITRPRYDLGFVDESQDVSQATYKLVTRMCSNVIFCGDKNQAILAFAGASEEMYESIKEKSDAVLPLKVTQRCPPLICSIANSIRPNGIITGPNTREGSENHIELPSLPEKLQGLPFDKVMVMSRTNAVIIGFAMMLYKKGIPCQIIDKDFSKEVLGFIRSFFAKDIRTLQKKMEQYVTRAEKSNNRFWISICRDKVQCIQEFIDEADDYKELLSLVAAIANATTGYRLTTIHKAKGLEAENVFCIGSPILPLAMDHPISKEQEINLHFVAVTRSSLNLTWVN